MKHWRYGFLLALGALLAGIFVLRSWGPSESLIGPDANHDGVRDDFERFADEHYRDEGIRTAAKEFHKSIQGAILAPEKWDYKKANLASDCIYYLDRKQASRILSEVQAETANTRGRIQAYWTANAKFSGTMIPGIKPRKEACSFVKSVHGKE
jgi:hypothetical protein